jgi:hypothetical protein
MDPQSGRLYGPLPTDKDTTAGDELTAERLRELRDEMDPTSRRTFEDRVGEALGHLDAGGRLVAVDGDAVQRLRLGDRELRRRKQRRS